MRLSFTTVTTAVLLGAGLSGCAVVPIQDEPEQPAITVEVPITPACFEVSALQRVEIPAETRTVTGVSLIENPPYAPIEQTTTRTIIMKQAEVFYVRVDAETGDQTEVTNFCDTTVVTGPVGPAPGELVGETAAE